MDLLAETEMPNAVERLAALGVDRALHPELRADPELVASAALGAAAIGAERSTAALAALTCGAPAGWLGELGLRAPERDAGARAVANAPTLARELRRDLRPSEIHAVLRGEPPETLALALALRAPAEPILRYVTELRGVRLEVTGDDLLAAGVPQSAAIGRALEETLRRKLDGELRGREEELRTAVELARS